MVKDNYEVVIRLENFKKNYGSFTAVNNINLEVKRAISLVLLVEWRW